MYRPTLAIILTLGTLLTTALSVPTIPITGEAINLSDRNALFSRALEGLEMTYLTDSSSLHKRTWPLWGHGKGGNGCDCEGGSGSGSGTGSGGGSGSGSAGAGAGAGAGGAGKYMSIPWYVLALM
jgi:hypothetical protein